MPTLPQARVVQTAIVGALALIGALAFGASPAVAQIAEADVLQDSELVLREEAGSGAYQHYAIAIATSDGKTVMTTNRDGVAAQFTVTPSDVVTLWRTALENGLETLPAAPAANGVPDSSEFVLTYRAQQRTGGFSAVGVDSLQDVRYRTIVRAILALASRYTGVH